jgi:Tol biopolymer transport system component
MLALGLSLGLAGCGGSGSPGDAIAMVSTRDGDYAIFAMNADGSDEGRLTKDGDDAATRDGAAFQIDPAYSPDGTEIAFASNRAGTLDIYVMDADGTNTRRLTSTSRNDGQPTWSPDGRQIAFQRDDGDHIYLMRADGTRVHRLTTELAPESEPAWSPDGRWIAYSRRTPGTDIRELWLVRPDGSRPHRLTTLDSAAYTPAWSPDAKTIAFAARHGGVRFDIFRIDADGTGLRRVTTSREDAFEPAWSPDGTTIAFSRGGAIVTIDREGRETTLTDPDNNDSSPDWNPKPAEEEAS